MGSPENEIMSRTATEESTTPPAGDEFDQRRQEFLGTGLPGDTGNGWSGEILDVPTGTIKRQKGHNVERDPAILKGNINNLATDLVIEASPEKPEAAEEPSARKPLAQPKLVRT